MAFGSTHEYIYIFLFLIFCNWIVVILDVLTQFMKLEFLDLSTIIISTIITTVVELDSPVEH